jgi:hypothetical protein
MQVDNQAQHQMTTKTNVKQYMFFLGKKSGRQVVCSMFLFREQWGKIPWRVFLGIAKFILNTYLLRVIQRYISKIIRVFSLEIVQVLLKRELD